ncbi:MAG TPA: Hsp33 family molecular chaperone HslO [Burkholderiaceae bacterium]|nr:Hsp33 family molecular chaperone HslO [Burkholderiaceae bacterium]
MRDELHKFLFEGVPVRGMLVRLGPSWQEVAARHAQQGVYPPPVRRLLGEMAAAATLMQANIKFDGALVLQVFGDGPVKVAVVEAQPDLSFRATAKVVGEVRDDARLAAMVNLHGRGRCAITLDPKDKSGGAQPYQGIVALHGDDGAPLQAIAEVLEHYMLQSEQLDTRLVLACNEQVAAGLLIQRLPMEGEGNLERLQREDEIGLNEAFNRIAHLAATVTPEELLTLDADTLLRRLFWEEDVRRFAPLAPRFACTCSRERVRHMLRGLGRAEVESILAERGELEIGCDFCGTQYRFDAVDAADLFTAAAERPPGSTASH